MGAGLSLLHVACTARIACKWVRESRLCSQNTTLPPYARRVRKPSPLIVRQGSRRLASRNVSRRPSEVEPSPERRLAMAGALRTPGLGFSVFESTDGLALAHGP